MPAAAPTRAGWESQLALHAHSAVLGSPETVEVAAQPEAATGPLEGLASAAVTAFPGRPTLHRCRCGYQRVIVTAVATSTLLVTMDLPLSMRQSDGTVEIVYSRVHPDGVKSLLSRSV